MATFELSGLEVLELDLEELAGVPDCVIEEMLTAEGDVVSAAQKRKLAQLGMVDTGQLSDSITVNRKVRKKNGAQYITVFPKGKRRDSRSTNGEVGFINEYGAAERKIKPGQWMRQANEESAGEAVQAAEAVYERWLKEKGL